MTALLVGIAVAAPPAYAGPAATPGAGNAAPGSGSAAGTLGTPPGPPTNFDPDD